MNRARSFTFIGIAVIVVLAGAAGGNARVEKAPRWKLVVASDRLEVMGANGRVQLTRPSQRHQDHSPTWSPDGRAVAFGRDYRDIGLYVVDIARPRMPRLLSAGPVVEIAWSPDGERIAFSRRCRRGGCRPGVYVIDKNGNGIRRLLALSGNESSDLQLSWGGAVSWSPDSQSLVCICDGGLWTVDADGSGARRLPERSLLGRPAWSPDGELIAYGHGCWAVQVGGHDEYYCDVAVSQPDGSDRRTVLGDDSRGGAPTAYDAPVWSDPKRLLVTEWGGGADTRAVDVVSGATRVLRRDAGWLLTAGPDGSFGYLDQVGSSDRSEVVIADSRGRTLSKTKVPVAVPLFGDDAELRLR